LFFSVTNTSYLKTVALYTRESEIKEVQTALPVGVGKGEEKEKN
jgi:hypothetical protein